MSRETTSQQVFSLSSTPTVRKGLSGNGLLDGVGSALMGVSERWLDPALPLSAEIAQEIDRRRAAHLDLQGLQQLADALIVDWYRHQQLLGCCLKRIRLLEVQVVLAEAPPAPCEPSAMHRALARELLAELQAPEPPATG